MIKAIIYKDDYGELVFCEDGRIFGTNPLGGYSDLGENLKRISKLPKTKDQKQKVEQLNKLLAMDYQDAAKTHLKFCQAKGRKNCKLIEGEFNEE